MQLNPPPQFSDLEELRQFIDDLQKVLRKISFGDATGFSLDQNMDVTYVSGAIANANADQLFTHKLGRVPVGWILIGVDKAAKVYNGATANTSTKFYLRSDTAVTTVKVLLF